MKFALVIFLGLATVCTSTLAANSQTALYTQCGKDLSKNTQYLSFQVLDVCTGFIVGTSQELVWVRFRADGNIYNDILTVVKKEARNGGINPQASLVELTVRDINDETSVISAHSMNGRLVRLVGTTPGGIVFSAGDFVSTLPRN